MLRHKQDHNGYNLHTFFFFLNHATSELYQNMKFTKPKQVEWKIRYQTAFLSMAVLLNHDKLRNPHKKELLGHGVYIYIYTSTVFILFHK